MLIIQHKTCITLPKYIDVNTIGSTMPHCTIEYSAPISQQVSENDLMKAVFDGALAANLFDEKSIKCRTQCYQSYLSVADQSNFVHVTIKIMSGRNFEQKNVLSQSVLLYLQDLNMTDLSITVDIGDLESKCYAKATA